MFKIYVVKLKNNKWYVGRTVDAQRKFDTIFTESPSSPEWVKMHGALQISDIRYGEAQRHDSRVHGKIRH